MALSKKAIFGWTAGAAVVLGVATAAFLDQSLSNARPEEMPTAPSRTKSASFGIGDRYQAIPDGV